VRSLGVRYISCLYQTSDYPALIYYVS